MVRPAIIFLLLSFGAAIAGISPAYCLDSADTQEVKPQAKTLEAMVVDIDWVGQKLVVKWLQAEGQVRYDQITIFVPEGTRITRGSETLTLSDLNVTDPVTVEYTLDPGGQAKAISINVDL